MLKTSAPSGQFLAPKVRECEQVNTRRVCLVFVNLDLNTGEASSCGTATYPRGSSSGDGVFHPSLATSRLCLSKERSLRRADAPDTYWSGSLMTAFANHFQSISECLAFVWLCNRCIRCLMTLGLAFFAFFSHTDSV